jgi:rhamnosyltransferase subunit B
VREQYHDIAAACAHADLLVTHPLTMAGPLVCAKSGLPWVSSVLAPASLMSSFDRPLVSSAMWAHAMRNMGAPAYRMFIKLAETAARRWERPLDALRSELGLPAPTQPALFRGQFSPRLTLALFPNLLAEPQPDWPVNTLVTGVPRFDGPQAGTAAQAALDAFIPEGDAPIVFALGSSVVMIAGDFWDKAIEASALLGRRAILLTGTPLSRPLPAGVKAFDYLPYSAVFPKAVAIVHQAGIGTLTQALAAGRPQLIVPVAFDQPDNARRAVELGVARSVPMPKVTAQRLANELQTLLDDRSCSVASANLAPKIEDGSDRAADALLATIEASNTFNDPVTQSRSGRRG